VNIIKASIAGLQRSELINADIEIIPLDLTVPESWSVPTETVFALRIFSPWEASKLTLFTEQGFETLELPAPAIKLSATDIRQSLAANDANWKLAVSPEAITTIQREWDSANSMKASA
jgi:hypothetical protein